MALVESIYDQELSLFVNQFEPHCITREVGKRIRDYCRGLLSDLPRKTAGAIARYTEASPRTLQHFLTTAEWDHDALLAGVQQLLLAQCRVYPDATPGVIGILSESGIPKRGPKTPGVAKQYLESLNAKRNGIIMTDLVITDGTFAAHPDSDLYLPESWTGDRDRCRAAGIPDSIPYRPPGQLSLDLLRKLEDQTCRPRWVTFTEGIGRNPGVIDAIHASGHQFIGEVAWNFLCRPSNQQQIYTALFASGHHDRQFLDFPGLEGVSVVNVQTGSNLVDWLRLIKISRPETGSNQYLLTNVSLECIETCISVWLASCRALECLRLRTCEKAISHFEGRSYVALRRHLTLCLLASAFETLRETGRMVNKTTTIAPGKSGPTRLDLGSPTVSESTGGRSENCLYRERNRRLVIPCAAHLVHHCALASITG